MKKSLKAYEVRDKYEGHCAIQFATNGATDLIEKLNAALTSIGVHVGATCCGVDVDDSDSGHTATAIITKIDDIVAERDALKARFDTGIRVHSYTNDGVCAIQSFNPAMENNTTLILDDGVTL
ncbi:MAG: hypothetical protein Q8L15_10755 [Methylobacter sp.]|nr:hypothetical protein [Methylobacter sp.]